MEHISELQNGDKYYVVLSRDGKPIKATIAGYFLEYELNGIEIYAHLKDKGHNQKTFLNLRFTGIGKTPKEAIDSYGKIKHEGVVCFKSLKELKEHCLGRGRWI